MKGLRIFSLVLWCLSAAVIVNSIDYNVGVLKASTMNISFDLKRWSLAIDLALNVINERFLNHHRIKLKKIEASYPSCSGAKFSGHAGYMNFKDNVIAIIGPACMFALEPVASLAAHWNTPIITAMGDQPTSKNELFVNSGILKRLQRYYKNDTAWQGILKNKTKLYPTLTRLSYCQCGLKLFFEQFDWKHIAIILDRSDLFSLTVGKNVEFDLKRQGLQVFVKQLNGNDEVMYDNYLKDVSRYARVVILSVGESLVRKFMLAAHGLGMTKGDWIFVDMKIFEGSYWSDADWSNGDKNDTIARKAYEALVRVSLLQPTSNNLQDFADKVKERDQTTYKHTHYSKGEEVDFVIGAFYDGVYLLGMALNETLSVGGNISDGLSITKRMWSRNFHGITGYVRIDDNGDRDADYSILDLNPITGKFEIVAHYYGLHKTYSPVPGQKIRWPEGREEPPPDIPKCGFLNDDPKCLNEETSIVLYGIVASGLIFAFSASLACIYFKHARRQTVDPKNMPWLLRPKEVKFELGIFYDSQLGVLRLPESINSLHSSSNFTTVGFYKGTHVCIKKITKKKMDINKKLFCEIEKVREITHMNTVRFLGACIESPSILIITEYCHRGSLREFLRNDEIHLDWTIRMSLIDHIAKGMCYLHNSEISFHGKLNSQNCLIDGRYVVKIGDFGLTTLMIPDDDIIKDMNYYLKLLWVAPELLPLTATAETLAMQKGDVYSFAIILEEIILRAGPFFAAMQYANVHEILQRVAARTTPPFRPAVDDRNCPDNLIYLMESCWVDNPDYRPSFVVIRGAFRSIRKDYYRNQMEDNF